MLYSISIMQTCQCPFKVIIINWLCDFLINIALSNHVRSKTSFHGVDLSSLHEKAGEEYLSQPVKGNFDEHILLAKPAEIKFDFLTAKESDLEQWVP